MAALGLRLNESSEHFLISIERLVKNLPTGEIFVLLVTGNVVPEELRRISDRALHAEAERALM
jgi:hypothetical protein